MSRVTQGVRLISLKDDQKVATVSLSKKDEEIENSDNNVETINDNAAIETNDKQE